MESLMVRATCNPQKEISSKENLKMASFMAGESISSKKVGAMMGIM